LAVLESEAAEAREFFSTLPKVKVRRQSLGIRGNLWRIAAFPALLLGGPDLSWLTVGGLRRHRRGAALETLLGGAIVVAISAVASLVIAVAIILALEPAMAFFEKAWPLLPLLVGIAIVVIVDRRKRAGAD